ncbi:MAG TPA: hypothetical protein VG148_08360 [Pyrinomonadaceae bacterium]|nr:hypothetical protein [Pyrinomonadaceae bacterium]
MYIRVIGDAVGQGVEFLSRESDHKAVVLDTIPDQHLDFAFVICPPKYPECWPYRRRCPCERPQS